VYLDLHALQDPLLQGTKAYYFTCLDLSPASVRDLTWWKSALLNGLEKQLQCTTMEKLAVTFGDGSGVGTGGTFTFLNDSEYFFPILRHGLESP